MKGRLPSVALLATFLSLLPACAPNAGPASQPGGAPQSAAGPKRITVAITSSDPIMLRSNATGAFGGSAAGTDVIEDLTNGGASRRDDKDVLQPLLAQAVPSLDNGLWKLLADGRMETSWTIKDGARWHAPPPRRRSLLYSLVQPDGRGVPDLR